MCEVLKSGWHSLNDRLCFVNFEDSPKFSGTYQPSSLSFMNMLEVAAITKWSFQQFERTLWMVWSFMFIFLTSSLSVSKSIGRSSLNFGAGVVSFLLRVSPCCERWFQRLHACGVSKTKLKNSGLNFELAVDNTIRPRIGFNFDEACSFESYTRSLLHCSLR